MKAKKIAIISDLHASLDMLNAFLEYVEAEKIERVLNLGDYISNGQNPCEVFDKITSDKRFINIRGYDEDSLFHLTKCKEGIAQGEWLRNKLGVVRLNTLKQMPSIKSISVNKRNILMCHTNGWADVLQLAAHTTKAELLEMKYEYICHGGSHKLQLTHNHDIFVNSKVIDPGALKETTSQGTFAMLDFSDGEPSISFRNISSPPNKVTVQKVKEDLLPQVEKQDDIYLQELKTTLLYIRADSRKKNQYIDHEIVSYILKIALQKSKYICIGCWSHEKQIISELLYHLKCRNIKRTEDTEQEWYIGEINSEVAKLVLENRLLPSGRLKWFEISFQDNISCLTPSYGIYHYGKEGFLKQLTGGELYRIEELLNKYQVTYSMPELK